MADPKLAQRQIPPYIGRLLWNGKPVGTGFIVHNSGLIATCYHVAAVPCKSDGDSPVGETFTFQLLHNDQSFAATVTKKLDRKNDVALLKADPFADKKAVARLISSENVKADMAWRTIGFGDVDDIGHDYHYLPATGTIDGPLGRDEVTLLKLQSSGILQGMSGGPVVVDALGGVVGLVSARYMIDPTTQTFLRDSGWASRIETLVALDTDNLKLQPPIINQEVSRRVPLLLALGVALLLAIGIVALILNSLNKPPILPTYPFTVAVSGFAVDPASGISASDGQSLAESFYNDFKSKIDSLSAELPEAVGVWEPSEIAKVGAIQGNSPSVRTQSAELLSKQLQVKSGKLVNILVYGWVTKQDGKPAIVPEFYILDPSPDLSELHGLFQLAPVLSTNDPDLIRALTPELTARSRVLSYIAEGVAQMAAQRFSDAHDAYNNALTIAVKNNENAPGQELLYVLLANASLGDYNRISAIGPEKSRPKLPVLLSDAETSFTNAQKVNGQYARALVGLAGTLYLHAVEAVAARDAWNEIDPGTLTKIEATYKQALTVTDIPANSDISTKVHFGLGQVAVLRDLRHEPNAATTAKKELSQVIADYSNGANPRVQELAAQAYGAQASLESRNGDFKNALKDYNQAISLTQLDARKEVFRNAVVQLTFDERRTAGDSVGAAKAAEDYLKLNISDTDAVKTLFNLGKTYVESSPSQPDKAVAAYERGVTNYPAADPSVLADLWHELGDKYYDQGDVSRSSMAYALAILYDPKQQGHLLKDGIGANIDQSWSDILTSLARIN